MSMVFQEGVLQVVRSETKVIWWLNNGVIGSVQVDYRVVEVPTSKLRAGHSDLAVVTVAEEGRRFDGSQVELRILAPINSYLRRVVQDDHRAPIEVLYHKGWPVKNTRVLDENFVFLFLEHEVCSVSLLLFDFGFAFHFSLVLLLNFEFYNAI